MPQYSYTSEDNLTIEKTFRISDEKPEFVEENGKIYRRDYTKENKQAKVFGKYNCWSKCKD